RVVLVGDGPERTALEAQAVALGVRGRLLVTGAMPDIAVCLAAADALAAPSRNEGMGRALVEAMALGLPVVASEVGGIPAVGAGAAHAAQSYERLPAIVHVHSDLSSGEFSLEELTDMAERRGLGAVLLSENYLSRVEYSLPPFRALTRVREESRSVHGRLAEYFARVAQARAARPRVLILPGVEVMPHYFWTG